MAWFIVGLLIILAGVIAAFFVEKSKAVPIILGVLVGGAVMLPGVFYTNDEGEATVLKSFSGEVVGQTATPGVHTKAPWVDALSYDIRNQQVNFTGDGTAEDASGPQITVQDAEGVSANVDIAVRYSIVPDSVTDIYRSYGNQENFVAKFIDNDIRAAVRTIPAQYGTLDFLNSRAEIEQGISDYLTERWAEAGVQVEGVSLQEIRYDDTVKQSFAEAQNARTQVEKAEAELLENQVKAESNKVLSESLTPELLKLKQLEALVEVSKNGDTIIVPEDFSGIVNLPTPSTPPSE